MANMSSGVRRARAFSSDGVDRVESAEEGESIKLEAMSSRANASGSVTPAGRTPDPGPRLAGTRMRVSRNGALTDRRKFD